MEFREIIMSNDAENSPAPFELAEKFDKQLKDVLIKKYSLNMDDLAILSDGKSGAYFDSDKKNRLCVLVLEKKDGRVYLVSAVIDNDNATDFKSDVIS